MAPSKVRRPAPRSFYLSGGLAVCAKCGSRLKGRSWTAEAAWGGRSPAAQPRPCCASAAACISAPPRPDFVASLVIARLSSPKFRARLEASANDPGIDDLYRRLSKLDAVADDLASSFGAGELDRRAYRVAAERNDAERLAVDREVRARVGERRSVLVGAPSTEDALVKWWEAATIQQRHALVASVVDEVRVEPAVRGRQAFDPDRLEVAWR